MAHQVCVAHGKRSVVTPTALIHRNGDGKKCNSNEVVSGQFTYLVKNLQWAMTRKDIRVPVGFKVVEVPHAEMLRIIAVDIEEDPGVKLLHDIFSNEDELEDEGYFGGDI